jgi:hypothetical protein
VQKDKGKQKPRPGRGARLRIESLKPQVMEEVRLLWSYALVGNAEGGLDVVGEFVELLGSVWGLGKDRE